ncbi:endoribonuclease L-PSP (plasmid) [Cupriavidus necator N-1]|uniref:Endoribonuclease L-PSP n=1 Tax=Cupriavidus necator (strain ATCC 43291 / DSM 13513 / CCUG 52238 / LMG 8453 / N-1) TaxID=1042878 RepID=F8GY18_CUPNN|nr:endoribonuclease L-PSP [Cupriavidus necator N-1]
MTSAVTHIQRHHTNARLSKIVRHGGLIYLCGQTARGSPVATGDIGTQTAEVLSRVDALLSEVGSDRTRLIAVTIYLRDMADFVGMNEAWEAWLAGKQAEAPARTTVEAALATEGLRVEMTVVAAEA